jgi:arylsulfatase A-like enzyme
VAPRISTPGVSGSTSTHDSFEFRQAYANGRNTAASFPAVHTSTHQRYYEGIGIPAEGTPTLAEVLSQEGYTTHAIHTNELVARDYNYDRGFEGYRDVRSTGDDPDEINARREVASEWEHLADRIPVVRAALNEYDWASERDTISV